MDHTTEEDQQQTKSDEGNIWRYNVGKKRQRRQHKVVVARDRHDENSEHEKLKICRYRLRKGTKRQKNDQNWITFCIILESNPLLTQPDDVTQSSNLEVAMNINVVKRI